MADAFEQRTREIIDRIEAAAVGEELRMTELREAMRALSERLEVESEPERLRELREALEAFKLDQARGAQLVKEIRELTQRMKSRLFGEGPN